MPPRATHEETLPAGSYRGEQLLLSATGNIEVRRTLEVRLEAGKAYRWRLATLLAVPDGGAGHGSEKGAVPP